MSGAAKTLAPSSEVRAKFDEKPGDQYVQVGKIGPEHKGRTFEFRDRDGDGWQGILADVVHYRLEGMVLIRPWGNAFKGSLCSDQAFVLMKARA